MSRWVALIVAWLLLVPLAAQAQTAPVEIKFVGTITASAPDTLMVRQADGSLKPWTGPLPDFPYVTGDQITVSFTATPGQPAISSDGIYRYSIVGASQPASGSGYARLGSLDVSGPVAPSGDWNGATGLLLVYNSNTGTYSLEMPTGSYLLGEFDGPGYTYDPATNTMAPSSTTGDPRFGCSDQGSGCFNVTGTMGSGAVNQAPIYGTDGSLRGFFSMLFSGDWFVNGVKQAGGVTQVPEPGQTGLFAMALAALIWRGRRRTRPATA